MRLIDADALFNFGKYKLYDAVKYGNKNSEQRAFSYGTIMMYEVADEIQDAPTIDATLVVHAKWKKDETTGILFCTGCLGDAIFTSGHHFACGDYCPNCGAKMDGKESKAER